MAERLVKKKENSSDAYIVSVMKLKACENVIVVVLSFIMWIFKNLKSIMPEELVKSVL